MIRWLKAKFGCLIAGPDPDELPADLYGTCYDRELARREWDDELDRIARRNPDRWRESA